jgi:hypothetical protein
MMAGVDPAPCSISDEIEIEVLAHIGFYRKASTLDRFNKAGNKSRSAAETLAEATTVSQRRRSVAS